MTSAAAELEEMLEAPLAEAVGKALTTGIVFEAAGVPGEFDAGAAGARGVPTATVGAAGAGAAGAAGAAAEQAVDPIAVSTIGEQPC